MLGCKILWTEPTKDDTARDIDALMSKEDAARFDREMNYKEHCAAPASNPSEGRFAISLLVALIVGGGIYLANAYIGASRPGIDIDYRTAPARPPFQIWRE